MDELGRQVDFHALRHTFNTNLARHGAPERVRMELMRHATLRMTSDVHTDASQLPTALTMERLPGYAGLSPKSPSHRASQNPDTTSHSGALPVMELLVFPFPQPVGDQEESHAGARSGTVGQKSENGCLARTRTLTN